MRKGGNVRRFRASKRRTSSSIRRRPRAKKLPAGLAEEELLNIIRNGVEQFILKDATVEEFLTMIRALTAKENAYSHQLTQSVFSKIVKEAIKKRNLRQTKKSNHNNSHME